MRLTAHAAHLNANENLDDARDRISAPEQVIKGKAVWNAEQKSEFARLNALEQVIKDKAVENARSGVAHRLVVDTLADPSPAIVRIEAQPERQRDFKQQP